MHLGERSNDLKRPPTASCRQCQTSALGLGGDLAAICFGSLLSGCRRRGATGMLALASRQCRFAIFLTGSGLVDLTGSGLGDGVSAGTGFAASTITPDSARALGSASLSDFADSLTASAGSILPGSCTGGATREAGGAATLIAIIGPRPTNQKTASHIVLGNQVLGNQCSSRVRVNGS